VQQELEDKTPFKNPRNAAAGSLRQKDSKITAERGLSIFVFNLQQCEGRTFKTHRETLDYIKSLGFPVSPRYSVFENIEDAIKEIEAIGEARGTLEFDIDGAVIKVNDLAAPWAARTSSRGGPLRSSIRPRSRKASCAISRSPSAAPAC
jgi:DNA ligase (NAD+)